MLRIYRVRECTSTQDVARELAEDGWVEGTVVIADRMTEGRGRLGRRWIADYGGLWMTVILRPKSVNNLQLINLAAGLSVIEGIKKLYRVPLGLKWPNDVLLEDRKVCGVLSEAKFTGTTVDYILLGIGINVNNELHGALKDTAISLKDYLGFEIPTQPILTEVLKNLNNFYAELLIGNTDDVISKWKKYSVTIGRSVKVYTSEGVIIGVAVDVDSDGSLIMKDDEGVKRIYSGDVIHLIHNNG